VSEGKGFLYRFPDRDFQLGVARVPEVGETVRAKGRMWTVVRVTHSQDNRSVVNLAPLDKPTDEGIAPLTPE
jgi:hypothetical protein